MTGNPVTRRAFSLRLTAVLSGLGLAASALGDSEDITQTGEAIRQEVELKASRKRVYEALTDPRQFDQVVRLSAAMKSGIPLAAHPTEIAPQAGGAFSLFAGHIVGRHLELTPDERIVQGWRVVDWKPGIYSIARFELVAQGSGTRLILDHTGFPQGAAPHLAAGWKANYWEPLTKYLG